MGVQRQSSSQWKPTGDGLVRASEKWRRLDAANLSVIGHE